MCVYIFIIIYLFSMFRVLVDTSARRCVYMCSGSVCESLRPRAAVYCIYADFFVCSALWYSCLCVHICVGEQCTVQTSTTVSHLYH